MPTIVLPTADGALESFSTSAPRGFPDRPAALFNRVAYAAAQVIADTLASVDPWLQPAIDWESTIAFRCHPWRLGLGVAEARTPPSAAWGSIGQPRWN